MTRTPRVPHAPFPLPARRGGLAAQRLRERDLAIIRWLARQRVATAAHVAERFSIGVNRTARRLGQLVAAGYLERKQPFGGPSAYLVTRTGIAVTKAGLPPARVDVRTYRHDLGVTSLVIELELAGSQTLTEREMRAREGAGGAPIAARFTPDARERTPRLHYPDVAVELPDGRVDAFELELTPKRTRRLTAILRAYRRSAHIARVTYYVERAELARRLEDIARALHMSEKVVVRWW